MSDQELVKRPDAGLPVVYDYGEHSEKGFENTTGEDFSIPFLALLQDISPQVTEKTIDGAAAGVLFNTVTSELYGQEVEFVPSLTEHSFVEWRPRAQGGGFVAKHELTSDLVRSARSEAERFGAYKNGETGNDLIETFYIYGVVVLADGRIDPIVLACSSTKISVYKKWISQLRMLQLPTADGRKRTPPLYANLTRIRTTRVKNPKGTFWNLVLEPAKGRASASLLDPKDPRFVAALGVRELIASGAARVDYTSQDEGAPVDGGADVAF